MINTNFSTNSGASNVACGYVRSAIYGSDDSEEKLRIQATLVREYCAANDLVLDGEPRNGDINDLLTAARAGDFTHLVVTDLSRISRDSEKLLLLIESFRNAGVTIHSVTDQGMASISDFDFTVRLTASIQRHRRTVSERRAHPRIGQNS